MGSLEIVQRAIAGGRVYDDLPPRIKNFITPNDWKTRYTEVYAGFRWDKFAHEKQLCKAYSDTVLINEANV